MPEWVQQAVEQVPSLVVLVFIVCVFLRHLAENSRDWGTVVENMNQESNKVASDVVKKLDRNTEVTEELMKALGANTSTLNRVEKVLDKRENDG